MDDNLHYFFGNDDITTAILSHLPVKILFKFRSVSKSWRDIIDSPSLRNLHFEYQLRSNNTTVNLDDDDTILLKLLQRPEKPAKHLNDKLFKIMIPDFPSYADFLAESDWVRYSGQVHGLICWYSNRSANPIGLCNPILKQVKILPESPHCSPFSRYVGLGYDSVEQDFKVVQLSSSRFGEEGTVVEVYSRKQNKWRKVGNHPLHRDIMILQPVPSSSSGGALAHWHATDYSVKFSRSLVVSFDVRREALEMIRIPHCENAEKHEVLATEDSLIVLVWPPTGDYQGRLDMWEYKLSGGGIDNYSRSKREDWIKIGRLGPFNGTLVDSVMWWKSDGFILKLYDGRCIRTAFYDFRRRQMVRCIRRKYYFPLLRHSRPTFISP